MQCHHLPLNQRHGRIAAAKAEHSDLQKTDKKLQVNHAFALLSLIQVRTAPMRPLAITT